MNVVKVKDMIFADAYIQMFDLLDDCVMVVDAEGKIVLYNKASEKLDGLNRKNVIGKHLLECFKIERFHSSTLRALKSKSHKLMCIRIMKLFLVKGYLQLVAPIPWSRTVKWLE